MAASSSPSRRARVSSCSRCRRRNNNKKRRKTTRRSNNNKKHRPSTGGGFARTRPFCFLAARYPDRRPSEFLARAHMKQRAVDSHRRRGGITGSRAVAPVVVVGIVVEEVLRAGAQGEAVRQAVGRFQIHGPFGAAAGGHGAVGEVGFPERAEVVE